MAPGFQFFLRLFLKVMGTPSLFDRRIKPKGRAFPSITLLLGEFLMFAQCLQGNHSECHSPAILGGRQCTCNCPCHKGKTIPKNPCTRCKGTGYYGPISVEKGICFACGGSGEKS